MYDIQNYFFLDHIISYLIFLILIFPIVDHFGPEIKTLNLSNYEDIVEKSKSDVLINFSAPWCSICVRNHPVYQELAKRISKVITIFLLQYCARFFT